MNIVAYTSIPAFLLYGHNWSWAFLKINPENLKFRFYTEPLKSRLS